MEILNPAVAAADNSLSDLHIEEIVPLELDEEGKGYPENLASSTFCCTSVSSVVI
jgi:hypothetical protein